MMISMAHRSSVAQGLACLAWLLRPNAAAAPLSALYLVANLTIGGVAPLLGKVVAASGLGIAIDLGVSTISFLAAVVIVLLASTRNSQAPS